MAWWKIRSICEVMEETNHKPVKHKHPLPGMCWVWPIGGIFLLGIGAMVLAGYFDRHQIFLAAKDTGNIPPPDDPQWNYALLLGAVGVIAGLAWWWLWYRFAIRRAFTRQTWHIGIGLILTGAAFCFLTRFPIAGMVYLLVLAIWAQGFTRQHFDKL